MTFLKSAILSAAALALLAVPSQAQEWRHHGRDWHGRDWHRGGGPRVSVGIGVPLFVPPPAYYGPTYYGPAYYEPVPRPVVVARPLYGDVSVDVQRVLARKGYYCGVIDGDLGPQSRAAIRAWQADVGLAVTGTPNRATLRSLGL